MYHPLLPLPKNKDDPPVYTDVSILERTPGATQVRNSMLRLVQFSLAFEFFKVVNVGIKGIFTAHNEVPAR